MEYWNDGMMRLVARSALCLCALLLLLLIPAGGFADYRVEMIPRISLSEVYDDNINLDVTNEESDYLTTVSPGINLTMSSQRTSLSLDYSPTWVWYDENDQNDTVRHAGSLALTQRPTEHTTLSLSDTYTRSEEPLETDEEIQSARRSRNTYQRNSGSAGFSYQFGPENTLNLGFRHSYLKNEDPTLDDGTIQSPFANITYWFNVKNGLDLNYGYTKAIFWRDDGLPPGDDYEGHAAGMTYNHRFTTSSRGSAGYTFTSRDFEGTTENYEIHEGSIDFAHDISPDLSLGIGVGGFIQDNETSDDEAGLTYDISLRGAQRFERGRFSLASSAGWDEAYLEAERRGFTRFWRAQASIDYSLTESLSSYARASYRRDKDTTDREWQTWRGNAGLRLAFLRYFSASLDYTYTERDDEVDTGDYRVNRLMLILTATKPQRL
jgi:hypothetical protein